LVFGAVLVIVAILQAAGVADIFTDTASVDYNVVRYQNREFLNV